MDQRAQLPPKGLSGRKDPVEIWFPFGDNHPTYGWTKLFDARDVGYILIRTDRRDKTCSNYNP